jgi:hypothetical protein
MPVRLLSRQLPSQTLVQCGATFCLFWELLVLPRGDLNGALSKGAEGM